MPVSQSQPTITVKTADGKTVKMTLAEFRASHGNRETLKHPAASAGKGNIPPPSQPTPVSQAKQQPEKAESVKQAPPPLPIDTQSELNNESRIMKQEAAAPSQKPTQYVEQAQPAPQRAQPIQTKSAIQIPRAEESRTQRQTAAIAQVSNRPSIQSPNRHAAWEDDDHLSLLDIPFEGDRSINTASAPAGGTDDTKISSLVGKFSMQFALAPSLEHRLRSLLESRAKDIRTDEQMREYAKRDLAHGGLGLSEEQTDGLMEEVREIMGGRTKRAPPPQKISAPAPRREPVPHPSPYMPPEKPRVETSRSQMLHDVAPSVPEPKESVGPAEEMRAMTRVDFRRLGKTPKDAAEIIARKFDVTQAESFLLFLDMRDAWRESPLSQEYFSLIVRSLGGEGTIAALGKKGAMTAEEFTAIAGVNKKISA